MQELIIYWHNYTREVTTRDSYNDNDFSFDKFMNWVIQLEVKSDDSNNERYFIVFYHHTDGKNKSGHGWYGLKHDAYPCALGMSDEIKALVHLDFVVITNVIELTKQDYISFTSRH